MPFFRHFDDKPPESLLHNGVAMGAFAHVIGARHDDHQILGPKKSTTSGAPGAVAENLPSCEWLVCQDLVEACASAAHHV